MSRRLIILSLFLLAVWGAWTVVPCACGGSGSAVVAAAQTVRTTIVGSVVDASLSPLANVSITLELNGAVRARTTTDATGVFRFTDVAPGAYRIRAERQGFPTLSREITIAAGLDTLRVPLVMTTAQDKAAQETSDATSGAVAAPPPPFTPMPLGTVGAGRGGRGGAAASQTGERTQPQASAPSSYDSLLRLEPYVPSYGSGNSESYAHVEPNRFHPTADQPLSTFGADVDTASYANVRRFLSNGQLPPEDAVRLEELVNYFHFDYAEPRGNQPIAITSEIGDAPWAPSHKLVLIGARAKRAAPREITGRNLVLLIDVSGSMAPADRLPLLKTALGLFVDTLRPNDRLAIVTYAGSSGVALPSTPVRQRDVIQRAIANLSAGGSTNGGQGIILAYRLAREAFISGGVNRVMLATDGDFNVGITSQQDLLSLIERQRDSGIFLSVLGVGSGNLKDSTMEMLADKGNGMYAYLDSLQEARRVLIGAADSTLETVAKDVKFQVEFNPRAVSAWKLLGYENRALRAQDFNNDRKDAGDMGAGHTVTVLYEVVPAGVAFSDADSDERPDVDPLRYQVQPAPASNPRPFEPSNPRTQGPSNPGTLGPSDPREWLMVKTRYKTPEGETSDLLSTPVRPGARLQHLPFAAAVAEFGLLLRDGSRDTRRWDALSRRVAGISVPAALAADKTGFAELVDIARGLAKLQH